MTNEQRLQTIHDLASARLRNQHTAPSSWSHGSGLQFVAQSGNFMHLNVPIAKGISLLGSLT